MTEMLYYVYLTLFGCLCYLGHYTLYAYNARWNGKMIISADTLKV
jgi:hypothetical protein